MKTDKPAGRLGRSAFALWTDNGRAFGLGYNPRPAAHQTAVSLVTPAAFTIRAGNMRRGHEHVAGPLACAADRERRHHAVRISPMALAEGARDGFLVIHGSRASFYCRHIALLMSIPEAAPEGRGQRLSKLRRWNARSTPHNQSNFPRGPRSRLRSSSSRPNSFRSSVTCSSS